VVPLWYGFDSNIGVWILTNVESVKTRLMREAGRFALCVQDDTALAYRHVSVQGPIVEERPCELERDLRPLAHRYLGIERGDAFVATREASGQLIFTMQPERWVTADYRGLISG